MAEHHFTPETFYNTIGSHEPALYIKDGDTVMTSTLDAHGGDRDGTKKAPRSNPMTGPIYVEGAEPGDALMVTFESIVPNRDWGWAADVFIPNLVDPDFAAKLPTRGRRFWQIDAEKGTAWINDPQPSIGQATLPLSPFVGCFGVAPPGGQAISTSTSGPHGGNMDYRGFVAGVTAYFPVFVEGALLHLGDGHALQGDGEITGTGIEISLDVRFRVEVLKGKSIHWPRGESATHLFTVGNARPMDQALQHATTEMVRWLREDYGMDAVEASVILGQCVEYDIGNVCNPANTIVCKLNKQVLNQLSLNKRA